MSLGNKIRIVEVILRDGFQHLKESIPTDVKVALIRKLADCGIPEIEIGSFVHPNAFPQFANIKSVAKGVLPLQYVQGTTLSALIPNIRGAKEAIDSGIHKLIFSFSVSRSHNVNSVGQFPDNSLESLKMITKEVLSHDITLRVDLDTVFGCPFEGAVRTGDVLRCVEKVAELGVAEITLCDTIGMGNPKQVSEITSFCMEQFPDILFGVHFHNTRGLALTNALSAYHAGIRSFDASIGGIGECTLTPGTPGSMATEDLVFMFNEMGIKTGIDLQHLLEVAAYIHEQVPAMPVYSSLFKAGLPRIFELNKGEGIC